MTTLVEILESEILLTGCDVDFYNPLLSEGGFAECSIVGLRFDVVRNRVGAILDLKNSLQLDPNSNTGVIVFDNVENLSWNGARTDLPFIARVVVGSTPSVSEGRYELIMSCSGAARLVLQGSGAVFFRGTAPGMDAAPPDFGSASVTEVVEGIQSWDTSIEIQGASTT